MLFFVAAESCHFFAYCAPLTHQSVSAINAVANRKLKGMLSFMTVVGCLDVVIRSVCFSMALSLLIHTGGEDVYVAHVQGQGTNMGDMGSPGRGHFLST